MKKIIVFIMALALSGCWIGNTKNAELPILQTSEHVEYVLPTINIDKDLLTECGNFIYLPKKASFDEDIRVTAENTLTFIECKKKQKKLSELLKNSLNLE